MSGAYREDLNWLVTDFTTRVADVAHAIVVSADGVPLALSAGIPEAGRRAVLRHHLRADQPHARAPRGSWRRAGHRRRWWRWTDGLMFVKAISDGSSLAVLAAPECDTRQVAYEMTRLVEAVGELLTPAPAPRG